MQQDGALGGLFTPQSLGELFRYGATRAIDGAYVKHLVNNTGLSLTSQGTQGQVPVGSTYETQGLQRATGISPTLLIAGGVGVLLVLVLALRR